MHARTQSISQLAAKEKELFHAKREAVEEQQRIATRLSELRGQTTDSDSVYAMPSMQSLPTELPSMEGACCAVMLHRLASPNSVLAFLLSCACVYLRVRVCAWLRCKRLCLLA